ncbi:LPXTG cell wall anchor domain-containing protein [Enterococcus hulanensis]|uniref:LPXTG cell wall anchor domain-containing protein n=1 Tax=Enterococcus hulanensis TaxID=2559929 RepID=A0ABU3EZI7_9ENTE|nr:LPXTG cell wall anchor domain-containing protein [Enterococcus hulanensis]MDT2600290.1 LPXTG cell wall anchor domain-containing protein [Enterococcus hulanensis]MDT2609103.1 LPXTG cell wall anchor domain-containing protein [Enterococcus hulanensis]MDT2616855.1 LPXTG cell wall anchor domain-containing protein [Enterococcus hulanensis]MDT2628625.1 LPXTG cell wall anchor domain-containing protein [Enterococcus hulanensis]MDT2655965.1 LPXTG cell wall anchor domain-containing protein [Enterococc
MKKKIGFYLATALFCLSVSCVSVLAASHEGQSPVGVGFYDPTSTSISSSTEPSTTSSTVSSSSSSSSSSSDSSSTVESSEKGKILPITNTRGGSSGGYWEYITDTVSKVLPKTGEFISNNLSLIGVGLLVIVFFYLRKNRRKRV